MQLELVSDDGDLVRLRCSGPIEMEAVGAHGLESFLGPGSYARRVLLDLRGAEFIDSTGVAWLVTNHGRFERGGGRLVVHTLRPSVAQSLAFLRLGSVLHLAANERAARVMALAGA
jgi:anti-anti-sigma factor